MNCKLRYPLILARCAIIIAVWFACKAVFGQTAKITGPDTGVPVRPSVFDSAGSEGTDLEWAVLPAKFSIGLTSFDEGRRAAFSAVKPGYYVVVLMVSQATGPPKVATHVLSIEPGTGPPSDDPPPLPPPVDLSTYTKRLTDDVQARGREFGEVSDIFFALAKRIRKDEFRSSSTAIFDATSEALFGAEGDQRDNWQAWYTAVRSYLLDDMVLVDPGQWADAFEVVGEAVER